MIAVTFRYHGIWIALAATLLVISSVVPRCQGKGKFDDGEAICGIQGQFSMDGVLEKIGQGRVSDGLILSNVPAEATRCDL